MDQNKPKDKQLGKQETVPPSAPLGSFSDVVFGNSKLVELNNPTQDITIDDIVTMRRKDGHARGLAKLIVLPILYALQNGEWTAPGVNKKNANKEVEFANLMWTLPKSAGGMSQPSKKIIKQILLSIVDGFAPFEQVYGYAKEGPLKGKYYLKKLSYCDPRTVKIVTDELGSFEGFRQRTITAKGQVRDVHVKKENALVFTNSDEENPYYGVSMFESAYPHYEIRKKLYYIAHLAAQFAAVPGRIGKVPARGATPQQVAEFKSALANFAFNTSMVHYNNFEVTPFNGNSSFDFLKLIDHHKNMMTKSILAGFFDSENRTVLIENATMDASADMFLLTLETIADDIAHILTDYLMPKFIDWNFGTGVYPKFEPAKLTDSSRTAIIDMFRNFAMAGTLNCTPEMVREMEMKVSKTFDLDVNYQEIAKREKEAAELQAQQELEQQQMEAQQQQLQGESEVQPRQTPDTQTDDMAMAQAIDELMLKMNDVFMMDEFDRLAPVDEL